MKSSGSIDNIKYYKYYISTHIYEYSEGYVTCHRMRGMNLKHLCIFGILIVTVLLIIPVTAELPPVAIQNAHQSVSTDFKANTTTGLAPLTVSFIDSSTGSVQEWNWKFGDGTEGSGKKVYHTYTEPGYYSVTLSISGPTGSDQKTRLGYIHVTGTTAPTKEEVISPVSEVKTGGSESDNSQTALKASFTAEPLKGTAPHTVRFTDTSSGSPASWIWNFGDGTSSDLKNTEHTYLTAGSYPVTLMIKNGKISSTSSIITITITSQEAEKKQEINKTEESIPTVPTSIPSPSSTPEPVNTQVTPTHSVQTEQVTIVQTTAPIPSPTPEPVNTQVTPTHSVQTEQVTIVQTTAPIPSMTTAPTPDSISSITPRIPVKADFSAESLNGTVPLTVKFSDKSTGDISSHYWDFGDGETSAEENPTHTYLLPGSYHAKLTISSDNGEKDQHEVTITAQEKIHPPTANFSVNSTSGSAPLDVQFTSTFKGSVDTQSWDFGDGERSAEKNPIHIYKKPGSYSVTLHMTGPGGSNEVREERIITVSESQKLPVADFLVNPHSGTSPLTITCTDRSTGDITSRTWNFGDQNTSSDTNPTHTYTSPGVYTVTLSVTGPGGSDETDTGVQITVSELKQTPVADFSADLTSGPAPLAVRFEDASIGAIDTHSWDFGDNTISHTESPAHTYSTTGNYTVKLRVSGPSGSNETSREGYITVGAYHQPPKAEFVADKTKGIPPMVVQFTDKSTGDADVHLWEFGDSTTSQEKNPTHTYSSPGNYSVTLSVTGADKSNKKIKEDLIQIMDPNEHPKASFTSDLRSGEAPLNVRFSDISTGFADTRMWYFGDGTTAQETEPEHNYTKPGEYAVKLMISGPGGSDEVIRERFITVSEPKDQSVNASTDLIQNTGTGISISPEHPGNELSQKGNLSDQAGEKAEPRADFVVENRTGDAPYTIQFSDSSSGVISFRSWDFGDGTTSQEKSPSHTYNIAGLYNVTLTVTGAGRSNTTIKEGYIQVNKKSEPPVAAFSTTNTSGPAPLQVHFTDASTGVVTGYTWSFGDNTSSSEKNPVHTYDTPGVYSITHGISGPDGKSETVKNSLVMVNRSIERSQASFTLDKASGTVPLTVTFRDTSSGDINTHSWDFGDGSSSREIDPVHTYEKSGKYTVKESISGAGGSDESVRADCVIVYESLPSPVVEFTGEPAEGPAPLTVSFTDLSAGPIDTRTWDLGDGVTSKENNPVHTYETPGTYSVRLSVSGTGGPAALEKTDYITVKRAFNPPVALLSSDIRNGTAPLTVRFTSNATGSIGEYLWNFGDGTNSSEKNPVHRYNTSGFFTVRLSTTGPDGANETVRNDYIQVYEPVPAPVAGFESDQTNGTIPMSVHFTDRSQGNVTSYIWNFGDGTNATTPDANHTYMKRGLYTVEHVVTGPGGESKDLRNDYINATSADPAPVARFGSDLRTGRTPLTIAFSDMSTGKIDDYFWDFGDGATSYEKEPIHLFRMAGVYEINLTVTGPGGSDSSSKPGYIIVTQSELDSLDENTTNGTYETVETEKQPTLVESKEPDNRLVANFSASERTGNAPVNITFTDLSTGSVRDRTWNFGDGIAENISPVTHTYDMPGNFSVSLKVTGPDGSSEKTIRNMITIF